MDRDEIETTLKAAFLQCEALFNNKKKWLFWCLCGRKKNRDNLGASQFGRNI